MSCGRRSCSIYVVNNGGLIAACFLTYSKSQALDFLVTILVLVVNSKYSAGSLKFIQLYILYTYSSSRKPILSVVCLLSQYLCIQSDGSSSYSSCSSTCYSCISYSSSSSIMCLAVVACTVSSPWTELDKNTITQLKQPSSLSLHFCRLRFGVVSKNKYTQQLVLVRGCLHVVIDIRYSSSYFYYYNYILSIFKSSQPRHWVIF